MRAITNKNNEILTRYVLKAVSNREWGSLYSQIPAYRLVGSAEKDGTVYGKKVIFRAPLTGEWLKEQEDSGMGARCSHCRDTGVKNDHAEFCHCEIGQTARKYFGRQTNLEENGESE